MSTKPREQPDVSPCTNIDLDDDFPRKLWYQVSANGLAQEMENWAEQACTANSAHYSISCVKLFAATRYTKHNI